MGNLLQDLRVGLRMLLRQPVFAVVVVLTLGLAIGVNAVVFSFVSLFALRPLPFRDVDRLARLSSQHSDYGEEDMPATYADFLEWRRENRTMEDLAAYGLRSYGLTFQGDTVPVQGSLATASCFTEWGMPALHGRTLLTSDETPGAPRVAVLAHHLWATRFGSDPAIVGRSIILDGNAHTIVGVLTPAIEIGSLSLIDLWTALAREADPEDRTERTLLVTGRLKPGTTLDEAVADFRVLAETQQRDHRATNAGWTIRVQSLRSGMADNTSKALFVLLAVAVGLLLAMACANVANLMSARAITRQHETAMRAALGATRGRLVRQFLTEGTLLAVAGGLAGVAFAGWGLALIRSITLEKFFQQVTIDRDVLAFTACISLATPLLFALAPALRACRRDLVPALGRETRWASRARYRGRTLVVLQLSLAVFLLLLTGVSLRTMHALHRLDLGYPREGLVTLSVGLPASRYAHDEQIRSFVDALLERLRAVPGARSVGAASTLLVLDFPSAMPLTLDGRWNSSTGTVSPSANRVIAEPGYLPTIGLRLLKGRTLLTSDGSGGPGVAVVSRSFVARYFGEDEPLGRRIRLGQPGSEIPWLIIVGVASDVLNPVPGQPPAPYVYVPFAQHPPRSIVVVIRARDTAAVTNAARTEVARLDPNVSIRGPATVEKLLSDGLNGFRLVSGMFAVFGAVALFLAAMGLYAVVSHSVSVRVREIGIRRVLGADATNILRMLLGQGAVLVVIGLGIGLLMGLAGARAMSSAFLGVRPTDPVIFVTVPATLAAVGLLAILVPAVRATRTDPALAVRTE